jgi:DNA-binding response OmpR family regulator
MKHFAEDFAARAQSLAGGWADTDAGPGALRQNPAEAGRVARAHPTGEANKRARRAKQTALLDAAYTCPTCGCATDRSSEGVIKRGAVVLTRQPLSVTWRGRRVPLSPTEAHVFATVMARGRASYEAIEEALRSFGSDAGTRAIVLCRIRRKFEDVGADDPFERVGLAGVRFVAQADAAGSKATVIGLR